MPCTEGSRAFAIRRSRAQTRFQMVLLSWGTRDRSPNLSVRRLLTGWQGGNVNPALASPPRPGQPAGKGWTLPPLCRARVSRALSQVGPGGPWARAAQGPRRGTKAPSEAAIRRRLSGQPTRGKSSPRPHTGRASPPLLPREGRRHTSLQNKSPKTARPAGVAQGLSVNQ